MFIQRKRLRKADIWKRYEEKFLNLRSSDASGPLTDMDTVAGPGMVEFPSSESGSSSAKAGEIAAGLVESSYGMNALLNGL
jgi:hypothetical protein